MANAAVSYSGHSVSTGLVVDATYLVWCLLYGSILQGECCIAHFVAFFRPALYVRIDTIGNIIANTYNVLLFWIV